MERVRSDAMRLARGGVWGLCAGRLVRSWRMRVRAGVVGAILVVSGCSKPTKTEEPPPPPPLAIAPSVAPPSIAPSVSAAASAVAPEVKPASTFGLAAPAALARGPIKVAGYPKTVYTGMNDPATRAGFSADGEFYGYCSDMSGDEPRMTCVALDRAGKPKTLSTDAKPGVTASKKAVVSAWLDQQKLPTVGKHPNGAPPKLEGEWPYSDIELKVGEGKLGGAVGSDPAVYPVVFKPAAPLAGVPYGFVALNSLALSPDGNEIGAIGLFFCGEWCNEWDVRRWKTGELAALVYNDTGVKHHAQGDYKGSSALFRKAFFANPSAKLPIYNLACALARLGEEAEAQKALKGAVTLDPGVRDRAPKDKDFAKVATAAWFTSALAP